MDSDSPKTFSWAKALTFSLVAGLLVAAFSIFIQGHSTKAQNLAPSAAGGNAAAGTVSGLGASYDVPALPVRLEIPAIGLDAAIQDVGMSWSGVDMGVPTNFTDVGWYKYGPRPGMPGNAVIDGHLDGRNVPEAVFYHLQDLVPGDLVDVVDASGTTRQFKVTGSELYPYASSTQDIFVGDASADRLNLITCAGTWLPAKGLYNERVVVFTTMVTSTAPSSGQ